MKKTILFIILLTPFFSFSQKIEETFNGEIHFVSKKVFTDKEQYFKDVDRYLDISDSILKIRYQKNPNDHYTSQFTSLEACLKTNRMHGKMALDPSFTGEKWTASLSRRYMFKDSVVSISTNFSRPSEIDRNTLMYLNRFTFTNGIKTSLKYNLGNNNSTIVKVDSLDTKVIAGIKCVKVVITYDDIRFKNIKANNSFKTPKIILETYVTNLLKTKFHPSIKDSKFLDKYYPLYVKKYSTGFRGLYSEDIAINIFNGKSININSIDNIFKNLNDSLLKLNYDESILKILKHRDSVAKMKKVTLNEINFNTQLKEMKDLGYELNPLVKLDDFLEEIRNSILYYPTNSMLKKSFQERPYSEFYFSLGYWSFDTKRQKLIPYSNKCFLYTLDYLKDDNLCLSLMESMSEISDRELVISDIKLESDNDSNRWVYFIVNGKRKKWSLGKESSIDDSFISRFTQLTEEFNTKGKFTYFSIQNDDWFLIDYATPEEQKEFNQKTGLQREWLTSGKHFSEPKN